MPVQKFAGKIPEGYHSLQPYLIFKDTAKAIAFYVQAFGGREKMRMNDGKGRIAHAEVVLGDSVAMMADEHPEIEAWSPEHYNGSPINLMLYVEDCDTTYKAALEAGATSLREPANQEYGDRMAGVLDPFGYKWWIAHALAKSEEK
jgi:PhnB protein